MHRQNLSMRFAMICLDARVVQPTAVNAASLLNYTLAP